MPEHRFSDFAQGRLHFKLLEATAGDVRRYRVQTQPGSYEEGIAFVWMPNAGGTLKAKRTVVPPGTTLAGDTDLFTDIIPPNERGVVGETRVRDLINHVTVEATGTGGVFAVYGEIEFIEVDAAGRSLLE